MDSAGKDLPLNVKPLIEKFHEGCRAKRVHFTQSQILNADETNIQLDSPDNYTYDKRGGKRITAATTGQQKTNLSIMICASANGEKLLPVFTLPRKRKLKDELLLKRLHYCLQGKIKDF